MKDFHFYKNGFSFILRKLSGNCAAGFFPLFYGNIFNSVALAENHKSKNRTHKN
jgi:hypothetical protein